MFDFPTNPTSGTVVMVPDGSYRVWDSAKWRASPSSNSINPGAPYLPLTGGTVTGGIRGMNDQSLGAGGTFNAYLDFASSISGVRTAGDNHLAQIRTYADTLDAGAGGLVGQYINLVSGGTGTSGNRVGQYIDTYFSGSTLDAARGYPSQYAGQWIYAHASGNTGGTSLGASRGQLWGGLSSATLQSGATFWSYCIAHEFNLGVSSGASAAFVQGIKIAIQNHNQPSNATDFLFGMSKVALSDQQFANGIVFGTADGYWPITSGGTLIGTQASVLATPPARTAANGVDFSAVTFSGMAFKSNGFQVDSAGDASMQNATVANGLNMGANVAPGGVTDLSKHITLGYGSIGFNITPGRVNHVASSGNQHVFVINAVDCLSVSSTGASVPLALTVGTSIAAGGGAFNVSAFGVIGGTFINAANDAAAGAAGIPVNYLYRNGNAIQVRLV